MLASILQAKGIEIELMMFGFPKEEINKMTKTEIQITRHLLSYMNRQKENTQGET